MPLMLALLKDVAALVSAVPELVPLLRDLVDAIRRGTTKEEKLTLAKRAALAAGAREALFEALPGKR
jgi:hypothetical protein